MSLGEKGAGPISFSFMMFSMAACLPLFFLGPIAYSSGLSLTEALLGALIGNLIVSIALILNGHYGIVKRKGFEEQAKEVFGKKGAKLVLLLRGTVGALWFGVEAFNGALALIMIALMVTSFRGEVISFSLKLIPLALLLYLATMVPVLKRGVEGIKTATNFAGPLLLVYFAWLFLWLHSKGFRAPSTKGIPIASMPFLTYLAIQTNWWATVAINSSDLTRGARNWKAVWLGTLLGLVGGQLMGTYLGYELAAMTGKTLPQEIIATYAPGLAVAILGLLFAFLAPWTTDITANLPALIDLLGNFLELSWEKASIVAVALGMILAPWWSFSRATEIVNYVSSFASNYGVLLGPILGPMLVTYWIFNRKSNGSLALLALLTGFVLSYALNPLLGSFVWVDIGMFSVPFPLGLSWYIGLGASTLAYIIFYILSESFLRTK